MKTILWATLSANGNYARASAAYPPKPEATADFAAHALAHGNFIVGRRTFEAFQAQPARAGADGSAPRTPFANTTIVVVSTTLAVPSATRFVTVLRPPPKPHWPHSASAATARRCSPVAKRCTMPSWSATSWTSYCSTSSRLWKTKA